MAGLLRKLTDAGVRWLGYATKDKALRADALIVPPVVAQLEMVGGLLEFDWRQVPAASALPLVGYVYGFGKALAVAAREDDPEIYYFGAWRVLARAYPGRKDLIGLLRRGPFTAPAFVEGRDLGFEDALLLLQGGAPVKHLSGLLARHWPQGIGNQHVLQQMRAHGLGQGAHAAD